MAFHAVVQRSAGPPWPSGTVGVVAHRGAHRVHRENTQAAFRAARSAGADGVELDARVCGDGSLVVHHDPHLADGRPVGELRPEELPPWVPSLADAVAACGPSFVDVELKGDDPAVHRQLVDGALDVVAGADPARILVSSFCGPVLAAVRARSPRVATGLLAGREARGRDLLAAAAEAGHRTVLPSHHHVDAAFVRQARALGLAVHVWTVDDPSRVRELASLGVDAVITDRPERARQVLSGG